MLEGTFAFALTKTGRPGEPTTYAAHDHLDTWFLDLDPTVPRAYIRAILQCYSGTPLTAGSLRQSSRCLFGSLLAALYFMAWVSLTPCLLLTLSDRDLLVFVAVTLGLGLFPSYVS